MQASNKIAGPREESLVQMAELLAAKRGATLAGRTFHEWLDATS